MRGGQTPMDTSRLVALDTLVGTRGAGGDRAVRLHELANFMEQSIAFALRNRPDPKSASAVLASDTSVPTAAAWVSGGQGGLVSVGHGADQDRRGRCHCAARL